MGYHADVLIPRALFPDLELNVLSGKTVERVLFPGRSGGKWTALLLYCGGACGECRRQLIDFQEMIRESNKDNLRVMALSGDGLQQAVNTMWDLKLSFPVSYGVDMGQLKIRMGALYAGGKGAAHHSVILVDPDGKVVEAFGPGTRGPADWLHDFDCDVWGEAQTPDRRR